MAVLTFVNYLEMFQPCGYPIIVVLVTMFTVNLFFSEWKKIRLKTLSSSLVKKWRGAHANAKHVMFIVYFVCFGEGATETFWFKNYTFWRSRKEKNNTNGEFRGVLLLQLWINCQLRVMSPSQCMMIKTQSYSRCYNNFNVVFKQAEKLKSREMKEGWWRMNEEWWKMKDEWWKMVISSCWGVLITNRQTDGRTFVNVESLSRLKNIFVIF